MSLRTLPLETYAVSFFVLGINWRMQLQCWRREELFFSQLQIWRLGELVFFMQ